MKTYNLEKAINKTLKHAQKNKEKQTKINSYHFRNFPITITENENLWEVSGQYKSEGAFVFDGKKVVVKNNMSGVLEWCVSKNDATHIMNLMKKDPRFSNLFVQKSFPELEENEKDDSLRSIYG